MSKIGEGLGRPVLFVHQRRIRFDGFEDIENRRQRLIIDLDKLERVLRSPPVHRGHRHHWIAGVANFFHGENRLVAKRRTEVRIHARHLRDLRAGQDDRDAVQRFSFSLVDPFDARVRIGAAQYGDVEHARHLDVADVQRPPGYFWIGVGSVNGLSND